VNRPSELEYNKELVIISIIVKVLLFTLFYIPIIFLFKDKTFFYILLILYGLTSIFSILITFFFLKKEIENDKVITLINYFSIIIELILETYIILYTGGIYSNFLFLYMFTILSSIFLLGFKGMSFSIVVIIFIQTYLFYFTYKNRIFFDISEVLKIYYFNIISYILVSGIVWFLIKKISISAIILEEKDKMATIGEITAKIIHEIKNPLSTIIGTTQILEASASEEDKRLLDLIYRESIRLRDLMNNFFSFIRRVEPKIESVNIVKLIDGIVYLYSKDYKKRYNVDIEFNTENISSFFVETDANLLTTIIVNILLNSFEAVKDKDIKKIQINLEEESKYFILKIKDTGGGIDQKVYKKIFLPFISTKVKGTGLGLTIVKSLTEVLNIDIFYRNWEDKRSDVKGVEFTLIIPKVYRRKESRDEKN